MQPRMGKGGINVKVICEGCEKEITGDEIYVVDHEIPFCDDDCFMEFILNQYNHIGYQSRSDYIKEVEAQ